MMNENEEILDEAQKRFLKRHWRMAIVFAVVFAAAVIVAIFVFLWVVACQLCLDNGQLVI
ncbi:MAG: hypothetical protein ACXAEN_09825 [Candidatus Thorarchaeota archaeon]|jgi:uncharacterized RDD family membrane protein YckC